MDHWSGPKGRATVTQSGPVWAVLFYEAGRSQALAQRQTFEDRQTACKVAAFKVCGEKPPTFAS